MPAASPTVETRHSPACTRIQVTSAVVAADSPSASDIGPLAGSTRDGRPTPEAATAAPYRAAAQRSIAGRSVASEAATWRGSAVTVVPGNGDSVAVSPTGSNTEPAGTE